MQPSGFALNHICQKKKKKRIRNTLLEGPFTVDTTATSKDVKTRVYKLPPSVSTQTESCCQKLLFPPRILIT